MPVKLAELQQKEKIVSARKLKVVDFQKTQGGRFSYPVIIKVNFHMFKLYLKCSHISQKRTQKGKHFFEFRGTTGN